MSTLSDHYKNIPYLQTAITLLESPADGSIANGQARGTAVAYLRKEVLRLRNFANLRPGYVAEKCLARADELEALGDGN